MGTLQSSAGLSLLLKSAKQNVEHRDKLPLKDVLRNVLEETRMVLPGIQALFGFQLVAVFNASFEQIPFFDHLLHLLALLLTICAVACLMAPASYQRQVERDEVSSDFVKYASNLICLGMIPLLLSISLDTYVVSHVITRSWQWAAVSCLLAFTVLSVLWFGIPVFCRTTRIRKKRRIRGDRKAQNSSSVARPETHQLLL